MPRLTSIESSSVATTSDVIGMCTLTWGGYGGGGA